MTIIPNLGVGEVVFWEMGRFITLFFFSLITLTAVAVADATDQNEKTKVVNGVRVEKVATTSANYVYWTFTNTNNYTVKISYVVANYPAGVFVIGPGEQKKSYSAYEQSAECEVSVQRVAETEAERMNGRTTNKKRNI